MHPLIFTPGGALWSSELTAVALVVALLLALALLHPARERALRSPLILLLAHVALLAFLQFDVLTPEPQRAVGFASLLALLASGGRALVLLVFDVMLTRRAEGGVPRIVRDTAQGGVYVALFFLALQASGVEPGSLLTTSALLTAALGLSLQDTLGNLFAGLAIQMQRPFAPGDWIQFDERSTHVGRVLEINWRATRVVTLDEVEVTVPNAMIAKAPIMNYTRPSSVSRRSLYVFAPADVAPHEVHAAIVAALEGSLGVLELPAPSVVTNRFVPESGMEYWVRFFTDRFDLRDRVDGEARDRIWYAFRRLGISLPATQRRVLVEQLTDEMREREKAAWIERRLRTISRVSLFAELTEAEKRALAEDCRLRLYAAGEVVMRRGDTGNELFVLDRGEVILSAQGEGRTIELARLSAGDFFGERGAMTGEPRMATVTAATDLELLVVSHAALQRMLSEKPAIADTLSRALADRIIDVERKLAADESAPSAVESQTELLLRIRRFFSL